MAAILQHSHLHVTYTTVIPTLYNSVFSLPCIYLLHTTISQSGGGVTRSTGYELAPLRLDLEARVEQPQLHLEEDSENGLHFSYPASILLHGERVIISYLYLSPLSLPKHWGRYSNMDQIHPYGKMNSWRDTYVDVIFYC